MRSAESDGQKLSRIRREGQRTRSEAPSNRSLKREERINRGAAETLDKPDPRPAVTVSPLIDVKLM